MKRHILRAPQTDRYILDVPTKLSDVENDITSTLLSLSSSVQLSGAAPVSASFVIPNSTFTGAAGTQVALGTTVNQNSGFTLPSSGNLVIPVPATGVYAMTLVASWRSTVDTSGGVGPVTTNYTLGLASSVSASLGVVASFAGTVGLNNKMGPAVLGGPTALYASATVPLTAGESLTCVSSVLSESPAIGGSGLLAIIQLTIVRIA